MPCSSASASSASTPLPALLETLKFVSVAAPLAGERLVVFTCSGGDSLMSADRAAELGLALPEFSAAQSADLRQQLPAFATVSNPLDYNPSLWGDEAGLFKCFQHRLGGDCDAGLLILDYPPTDERGRADCDKSVDALLAAARANGKQPIVCTTLQETPAGGDARPASSRPVVRRSRASRMP